MHNLRDLWSWLGANGSALQAIGALAALPLLAYAGLAAKKAADAAIEQANAARAQVESAARAVDAAVEQATAAKAQVRAAEESSRLTEQQLYAALESAKAEREHSEVLRKQMLLTLTPVLIFTRRPHPSGNISLGESYALENQSQGTAFKVKAFYGTATQPKSGIGVRYNVIGPLGSAPIPSLNLEVGSKLHVVYESADERAFLTQATVDQLWGFTNDFDEIVET